MAASNHIRNPIEWGADQLRAANHALVEAETAVAGSSRTALPVIREIATADLLVALRRGLDDFVAYRSDVLFIGVVYAIAGVVLARLAFGYELVPLLFPLISGFALIGPIAAIGLYEMSRRRELGVNSGWADAFGVVGRPAFGAIMALGLCLVVLFLLWLSAAYGIYLACFGDVPVRSISGFMHEVLTTEHGRTLIIGGIGVGFLFAHLVLMVSVISFPLLLDRPVGLKVAVQTSIRAYLANAGVITLWGFIVAASLVLGALPALLGLIAVIPILGHATWHLYRRLVV